MLSKHNSEPKDHVTMVADIELYCILRPHQTTADVLVKA